MPIILVVILIQIFEEVGCFKKIRSLAMRDAA